MIPKAVVPVRLDFKKIYERHPKTMQLPEKIKDRILELGDTVRVNPDSYVDVPNSFNYRIIHNQNKVNPFAKNSDMVELSAPTRIRTLSFVSDASGAGRSDANNLGLIDRN